MVATPGERASHQMTPEPGLGLGFRHGQRQMTRIPLGLSRGGESALKGLFELGRGARVSVSIKGGGCQPRN